MVERDWAFFDLVTGMEITLDEMAWLERELAYEAWRRTPFRWPTTPQRIPPRTWLDHLAPMVPLFPTMLKRRPRTDVRPAWGWRYIRVPDRHAFRCVPTWLYFLLRVRSEWLWWICQPLYRRGWLEGGDGCYLWELRPRGWAAWWTPERRAGWAWVKTGKWPTNNEVTHDAR